MGLQRARDSSLRIYEMLVLLALANYSIRLCTFSAMLSNWPGSLEAEARPLTSHPDEGMNDKNLKAQGRG